MIKIKRIYDPISPDDGKRILVDRLWPRGIKKEIARIDEWLKEIAPGNELRKWFSHDPEKGDPDSGIKLGTPFENLPDDWVCPVCGADKSLFEKEV